MKAKPQAKGTSREAESCCRLLNLTDKMQAVPSLPSVEGERGSHFQTKPLIQDDQVEVAFEVIWGDDFADTLVGLCAGQPRSPHPCSLRLILGLPSRKRAVFEWRVLFRFLIASSACPRPQGVYQIYLDIQARREEFLCQIS